MAVFYHLLFFKMLIKFFVYPVAIVDEDKLVADELFVNCSDRRGAAVAQIKGK